MVRSFEVVYDDFSGGHFVGRVGTRPPRNAFNGPNVGCCPTDGTLLPLKAFYDATGAIGGNTAANTSRLLYDPASSRIVWAGDTQASVIATPTGTPPLAVSTVAIGAAVRPGCLPCAFNGKVLFPTATTSIISVVSSAVTATTISPGFTPNILCAFGNFVMAATTTNRIYFSNPGVETTWTVATDFIDVGDPGVVIAGMCVHQGQLVVATSVGMWVLTGVPGQTASLRQITTIPFTEPVSIDSSIVRTFGVQGTALSELAGTTQRALNYGLCPDGRPALTLGSGLARTSTSLACAFSDIGSITDEGGAITDLGATMWILDFYGGLWTRRQVTTAPVRMGWGQGSPYLFYRSGSPDAESVWYAPVAQEELVANSTGTPATGTVELSEYYRETPFRIKEVLCEVDYGSIQTVFDVAGASTTYAQAERSISVSVKAPGVPIENMQDLSMSRAQSTTLSHVLPARGQTGSNYTRRRSFVRFAPTDVPSTFTATPVVTLTGVKMRRLILRCEEVG